MPSQNVRHVFVEAVLVRHRPRGRRRHVHGGNFHWDSFSKREGAKSMLLVLCGTTTKFLKNPRTYVTA